jgi:ligand-binding SRPBCC domain-containing protein
MQLPRTTHIPADISTVFPFFAEPANLGRITPPQMRFRIVRSPGRTLRAGDRIEYTIRVAGVPLTWVTLITEWIENVRFVDVQERGPYAKWEHTHAFEVVSGGVKMTDAVEFDMPLGPIGGFFCGWFVRRQLAAIFDYRERVICEIFRES